MGMKLQKRPRATFSAFHCGGTEENRTGRRIQHRTKLVEDRTRRRTPHQKSHRAMGLKVFTHSSPGYWSYFDWKTIDVRRHQIPGRVAFPTRPDSKVGNQEFFQDKNEERLWKWKQNSEIKIRKFRVKDLTLIPRLRRFTQDTRRCKSTRNTVPWLSRIPRHNTKSKKQFTFLLLLWKITFLLPFFCIYVSTFSALWTF